VVEGGGGRGVVVAREWGGGGGEGVWERGTVSGCGHFGGGVGVGHGVGILQIQGGRGGGCCLGRDECRRWCGRTRRWR